MRRTRRSSGALIDRLAHMIAFGTRNVLEPNDSRQITEWERLGGVSAFGGPGGTDHTTFVCHKAPGIGTGALGLDYCNTSWHTNRDTFDKIVPEDLRNNATFIAMLAYIASEDPQKFPRDLVPQGNLPGALRSLGW